MQANNGSMTKLLQASAESGEMAHRVRMPAPEAACDVAEHGAHAAEATSDTAEAFKALAACKQLQMNILSLTCASLHARGSGGAV